MKPIEFTSDSYAKYSKDSNKKDPKFKVGDQVRISKHKNIFPEGHTLNSSEEVFIVSKIENAVPCTYAISDLNGENNRKFLRKRIVKESSRKIWNRKSN